MRFVFACWRYINKGIDGRRDILEKFFHIVDERSNFNLHPISSRLSYFGFSFQYSLVTIGVLEFVVVIDVYAQPAREKIKFYRTASNITVAGPLLTDETSLILYVLRTCPVRIRFGKRRELPI